MCSMFVCSICISSVDARNCVYIRRGRNLQMSFIPAVERETLSALLMIWVSLVFDEDQETGLRWTSRNGKWHIRNREHLKKPLVQCHSCVSKDVIIGLASFCWETRWRDPETCEREWWAILRQPGVPHICWVLQHAVSSEQCSSPS